MQMAVAPLAMDHRFRTVRNPEVFTAVLRTIPTYAAWLDALEPITDVFTMGGLQNTLRRLVGEGAPVATGLHALGEAVILRDILKEFADDWTAQSLAMDTFAGENIAPFYEEQAAVDGVRMAALRHAI